MRAAAIAADTADDVIDAARAVDSVTDTAKVVGDAVPIGGCFVAGTRIKTEDGSKNIEEIGVGDFVYAKNAETGETGYKQVVRLFRVEKTELIHLQIGNEVIVTTSEHPFWVDGYGFKTAGELVAGEYVENAEGNLLLISNVEIEYLDEPVIVYNFEVKDWHTYYVSDAEVFVHNKCTSNIVVSKPSSTTKVNHYPETKASTTIKYSEATDAWDKYLGKNTTDINPRTGMPDPDRIFSADGTKSIRFGSHEMNSVGTSKAHFHYETWDYDAINDVMNVTNHLQRMR